MRVAVCPLDEKYEEHFSGTDPIPSISPPSFESGTRRSLILEQRLAVVGLIAYPNMQCRPRFYRL